MNGMGRARELLREARRVAVLTGAGISAESGIPTFRGAGGLWRNFRPEELANHPAPFPFWVSLRDFATNSAPFVLDSAPHPPPSPAAGDGKDGGDAVPRAPGRLAYLPFRHRNHTVFWCQVEIVREQLDGQPVTLALLRRLPTAPTRAATARPMR